MLALLVILVQQAQPPQATIDGFRLPEGFSATLFAGEPDLRQPVGFSIDDRGRLWVIEGDSYPAWKPESRLRDRVWIFEDRDGDGRFDGKKLFADGLVYATGIETGFGGAWIMAPPNLLFYPDRDGDDRPDGPPEVVLDGFGIHGGHNVVNGFTWGPDGWLYGGHGRTSISEIGLPGTPPEKRLHFDGGVYRYHPTRRVFEAFADGTTNPWGIAFDEHGRIIVSNCVNAHLFHMVQGGHYEPGRDRPSSRHAYRRIDPIADHLHYATGRSGSFDGNREHDRLGGGHAHSGCLVYLGDSWPELYRGAVLMSNIHGHRLNMDLLSPRGSGFTAAHGADLLVSKDPMFIGLLLQTGPDGSVFVSDWYDRGECHTLQPDRSNGRIYKLQFGKPAPASVDLAKKSSAELVALQGHRNDWWVSRSRRLLQERGSDPAVHAALRKRLQAAPDSGRRLRALWALHVTGGLDPAEQFAHPDEHVRAWAVQLELEDREISDEKLTRLELMAVSDPSPIVRLQLATAARRIAPLRRVKLLAGLLGRGEDAADPNLPLVIWYAAGEVAEASVEAALGLMNASKLALVREFMARRLTTLSSDLPVVNVASMGAKGDGAADDAPAFAAAIGKLGRAGGRVLVPWGVRPYRIATPVAGESGDLELWGPGARLQFAEGAAMQLAGDRVTLKGLRLEGGTLTIRGASEVRLEDLQVKGGLRIEGTGRVTASKCRFGTLDLEIPERGAELQGVTVEREFRAVGDRSRLRVESSKLP